MHFQAQLALQEAAFLLAMLHPDPEARPSAQALSNQEQLASLYRHLASSRCPQRWPCSLACDLLPALLLCACLAERKCRADVHAVQASSCTDTERGVQGA